MFARLRMTPREVRPPRPNALLSIYLLYLPRARQVIPLNKLTARDWRCGVNFT